MGSFYRRSPIVPTLRYRDVEAAMTWLTTAFGFSPHTILHAADGRVASAQLVHGSGMIILAPVGDSEFDGLMRQPDEIGGAETQSCYFIVVDADAHYAAARSAGAEMILDLQNFEHGGRGYLCRDPEGHLWSFGTFNPWDGASETSAPSPIWSKLTDLNGSQAAVMAGVPLLLMVGAIAAFAWWGGEPSGDGVSRQALLTEQSARADAERKASAAQAELARLREDQDATDLDSAKLQEQVVHLVTGKEKAEAAHRMAEATAKQLADRVSELQLAKTAADRSLRQHMARAVRDRRLRERIRRDSTRLQATMTSQTASAQRAAAALQEAQARLDREVAARKSAQAEQARIEQMLAEEREAKAQAETGLQQVSEQLKQEQAARRAAEPAQQEGLVPAPRPAVRPDR